MKNDFAGFFGLEAAFTALWRMLFGSSVSAGAGVVVTKEIKEVAQRHPWEVELKALEAEAVRLTKELEELQPKSMASGGMITTLRDRTRASTGSRRTSLQEGPRRTITRTDSSYERVPSGGKVSGYFDQNLERVTPEEAELAEGEIQSGEEYEKRFKLDRRIDERLEIAEGKRAVIGGIENEFSNEDAPIAEERMKEAAQESKEAGDDVDELVRDTAQEAKMLEKVEGPIAAGEMKIEIGALPDLGLR